MRPLKPLYKVLFYIIFTFAMGAVRILYPIRVIGKGNLAKAGHGCVICPNHIRAIDPLFVLLARGFKPKMLIMGKGELFGKNALLDFFWAIAGAFPIDRGTGDRKVLDTAIGEVEKGRDLLLFPEGTRSKTGELGRLKSGAFVVAMQAKAEMVPVVMRYRGGKPRPFHRCTVVFGKPLTMEALGLTGEYSARNLREAKKIFTQKLTELYEKNKNRM